MVTIRGTFGDDTLLGQNAEGNTLFGAEGADTLRGGSRTDFLQGNQDTDFVVGGDGGDTIYGGKGDDTLFGGNNTSIDTIEGVRDSAMDDADVIYGDLGNDVMQGNTGRDTLFGGDGADTVNGGRDGDSIEGGAGNDSIMGDKGDDTLQGNQGNDVLQGGAGNDLIRGGKGDDILIGGDGQDTLYGDLSGANGDTIITGDGNDLIVIRLNDPTPTLGLISPSTAKTTITDFKFGDRIIFEGATSSNVTISNSSQSASAIITVDGQSFVLNGVTANQISTNNITQGAEVVFAAPSNNGGGGGGGNPPAPATPVNTLPATYTTNEDTDLVLSGISVADSDTPMPASFTISTTNGILNILDNVASGITAGMIAGNGTTTITITGATLTQINATLVDAAGLTFVPTADYNGSATVTVTTNDGALSDTDTSTITIVSVQDSIINLSTLNGTNGFRLDGVAASDYSGNSVSNAGDVNGDGFDDIIIGAYGADPNGNYSGSSYVVFGASSGFASSINLSDLNGTNGFRLDGVAATNLSGYSASSAGDVNGDGFDDLIVGAHGASPNGGNYSGSSYLVFGKASGFTSSINLSALNGTTGFRLDGVAASDSSGFSVSSAGDVNGDGFDDIILGVPNADPNGNRSGSSYVVFGKSSGFSSSINLSDLDGINGFRLDGAAVSDYSGRSVSNAGDVNGDGFDDLIVGAFRADPNGNYSGSSYVVFGASSGFASSINLSDLNGTNGFRLDGVVAFEYSGRSVSSAGDVNGDGFDDLIVGAYKAHQGGFYNGASYVVFGKASGFTSAINLSALDGTTGFRLDGVAVQDYSGFSVSNAGDINGDGFDDVIVGASRADPNGGQSGSSYVVFGKASGFSSSINLSTLDGTNGYRLDGVAANDNSGRFVSAAGDVDGDGFDDLIVGARNASPNGSASGSSYVIFGSGAGFVVGTAAANTIAGAGSADKIDGRAGDDSISGGNGADTLIGGLGNDTLDGGTDSDLMKGGAGNDLFIYGTGDSVDGGRGTDTIQITGDINITALLNNQITGVEVINALSDAGVNNMYLSVLDAIAMAKDSNRLTIDGASGDAVILSLDGKAYTQGTSGGYTTYTFSGTGGFQIWVDSDITTTLTNATAQAATMNLSTLNGTTGFRLDGVAVDDFSGRSVSNAGDINGDGFDDLIVGAWGADINGSNSGSSFVVFGASGGFTSSINLSSLNGTTGFRLNGVAADDESSRSTSNAGDVNGDGIDDFIISGYRTDFNGSASGSSYVVFGKNDWSATSTFELAALTAADGFRLDGQAAGDVFGQVVSSAGDINGDGIDDLLVGARAADFNGVNSGSTYVVFGSTTPFASIINVSALDGTTGFRLNGAAGEQAGVAASNIGDVNGDGFDDIIFSSFLADPGGINNAGSSYVVFGKAAAFSSTINISTLMNGTDGYQIDGALADDQAGRSPSAGDINGDGFDDIILAVPNADPNGLASSGSTYVVFGKSGSFSNLNVSTLNGTTGFRLDGVLASDLSGFSVSAAGDVNGDGFDDLVVGAPTATGATGASYVIFGKASGWNSSINLSTLDGTNGYRLDGVAANDNSGRFVSAAGDVDGDGFDDLIVGAYQADPNGNSNSGSSYVIFGTGSRFVVGTSATNTIAGAGLADKIDGDAGNDSLTGGAGADTLIGGQGNDTIDGGNDADFIKGAIGNDVITGGAGADKIWGGAGNDIFVYTANSDSGIGSGNRDIIYDFESTIDDIDLSAFAGTFAFIGTGVFTGTQNEVRYTLTGTNALIQVDSNANGIADFEIHLLGAHSIVGGDFVL